MKLYYSKGACSLVVRIIINELNLACDFESVDLKAKKTASGADFLATNEKGSVPVLITNDGETLTENAVILQYLADTNHATQLLPNVGDFKRYRVLEWVNFITTELHKGFSPLFNPDFPQEAKDKFTIPNLNKKFSYLEKHLETNNYLYDGHFTLPDAYLFVILIWSRKLKPDVLQNPTFSRYFNELLKRDSIVKSLQEEDIHIK